jgi:WD40 repeat protein
MTGIVLTCTAVMSILSLPTLLNFIGFNVNLKYKFSSNKDNYLIFLNFQISELSPHDSEVSSIGITKKYIISTGWDRNILVHDSEDLERTSVIRLLEPDFAHSDDITCMKVVENKHFVITGSTDRTVKVWDYESGKWHIEEISINKTK